MRELPTQRQHCIHRRLVSLVRAVRRCARAIHEPIFLSALLPIVPFVKSIPAHPMAAAQFRYAPIPGFVLRKHPDTFLHCTGLQKWHRRSSLRCNLTCRPSSRSKMSAIYPVRTHRNPLTPPSPLRGEGVKRRAHSKSTSTYAPRCAHAPGASAGKSGVWVILRQFPSQALWSRSDGVRKRKRRLLYEGAACHLFSGACRRS
jgi:hypothetical protein